jgi:hypothetical protein
MIHPRFIDALRKAAMISDKQNRIATHVPLVQDLPVVSEYQPQFRNSFSMTIVARRQTCS